MHFSCCHRNSSQENQVSCGFFLPIRVISIHNLKANLPIRPGDLRKVHCYLDKKDQTRKGIGKLEKKSWQLIPTRIECIVIRSSVVHVYCWSADASTCENNVLILCQNRYACKYMTHRRSKYVFKMAILPEIPAAHDSNCNEREQSW